MNSNSYTYVFEGQELELLDDIASKFDRTRSVVITVSLLSFRMYLHIPNIHECSLAEWIDYYNNYDRDDDYLGPEEANSL